MQHQSVTLVISPFVSELEYYRLPPYQPSQSSSSNQLRLRSYLSSLPVLWTTVLALSLTTLDSAIHRDFDHGHLWAEVFRDTSELRIIRLESGHVELIRTLHPSDNVVPVPTLTDIRFRNTKFEQGECLHGANHSPGKGCLRCLRIALASRAEAGLMLPRLALDSCTGITKENVMELSKVVGQAEWT